MANFRANREGVMMNCSIPEIALSLKDCELMENFGVIELTSKINICVISLNYFIMQHGCNPKTVKISSINNSVILVQVHLECSLIPSKKTKSGNT